MYLPIFPKKKLLTDSEQHQVVAAIQAAEHQTSGEIRVYIERRCKYVDPLDRAVEIFGALNMQNTAARNGVLVYVALKDRQLAIFGDQGIHEKVDTAFWNNQVRNMLGHFTRADYAGGIARIVGEIGAALQQFFPYDKGTDKNELPDDIVFGR